MGHSETFDISNAFFADLYMWVYDHITLTHPLGVAQADYSQQIAAAGWGPKKYIFFSKVSSDVDIYL